MSVWSRLKSALTGATSGDREAPSTHDEGRAVDAPPARSAPVQAPLSAVDSLASLARGGEVDEERALALLAQAEEEGLEVEAIDHARRLLERLRLPRLGQRVAERLDARGDDRGAEGVLSLLVASADAPLDALMLAAEIAERRFDPARALSLYERILARDLGYPRAKERAFRLREAREEGLAGRPDASATLMGAALNRGRFRVLGELGRGGAGTVFLAEDVPLGRQVALKIYQRRGRADRERMLHEARLPAMLAHPSIVRVLDVDEAINGIAMELAGGSLRTGLLGLADRRDAIPFVRAAMRATADALAFVHRAGWVHRDIKPSNLLLGAAGQVVLTDFGIATRVGERRPAGEGSLGYLAPEQRAGEPAQTASDVHALGATLAELLSPLGSSGPDELVSLSRAAMRVDPATRPKLDAFRAL